jgi:hypothetical protein
VDSIGVKLYGEGEWKVRLHGKEKRRTWRKLHLLVDHTTHEAVALEMTDKAAPKKRPEHPAHQAASFRRL